MHTHGEYKHVLDDDNNPVPEPDLMKWLEWFDANYLTRMTVAREEIRTGDGEVVTVSTRFLAMSSPPGAPMFETMIFGGESDLLGWRHHTYQQALEEHERIVKSVTMDVVP